MWSDLHALLAIKRQCVRDARAAGAGGTLHVAERGGAETFTLDGANSGGSN